MIMITMGFLQYRPFLCCIFLHPYLDIAQIHEEQTLMKIAENHHRKKLLVGIIVLMNEK